MFYIFILTFIWSKILSQGISANVCGIVDLIVVYIVDLIKTKVVNAGDLFAKVLERAPFNLLSSISLSNFKYQALGSTCHHVYISIINYCFSITDNNSFHLIFKIAFDSRSEMGNVLACLESKCSKVETNVRCILWLRFSSYCGIKLLCSTLLS